MQAECEELVRQGHDLEARELEVEWRTRELEVEWRTRTLNLYAVRDAEAKSAAPWRKAAAHILLRNRHPLSQNQKNPILGKICVARQYCNILSTVSVARTNVI